MCGHVRYVLLVCPDRIADYRTVLRLPCLASYVEAMRFRKIVKMFEKGSVCVVGMRGTGKDMLIGNVVARRKKVYYSNVDYNAPKSPYKPLKYTDMCLGGNTYKNLLEGKIKPYKCPFEEGSDIYISDIGVLFPAQYCNELNRDYSSIPCTLASVGNSIMGRSISTHRSIPGHGTSTENKAISSFCASGAR